VTHQLAETIVPALADIVSANPFILGRLVYVPLLGREKWWNTTDTKQAILPMDRTSGAIDIGGVKVVNDLVQTWDI
jgi:hypothetical protein